MSTLSVSCRVGGCVFKIARKGNARNPSELFEVASARSGRLVFLTDFKVLRRAGILLWFQRLIQPADRRESFALHIASRWVQAFVQCKRTNKPGYDIIHHHRRQSVDISARDV